jgi:hypothetical protein
MSINNTTWINVPKDTTIVLSLEVPPGQFATGHVDCTQTGGGAIPPPPPIEDGEIRPGSAKRTMTSPPASYGYDARIVFGSACTATLRARLEKKDGTSYGDPFTFTVSGNAGEVKIARIICLMVPA